MTIAGSKPSNERLEHRPGPEPSEAHDAHRLETEDLERRRRRNRLLQFVARQIAADLDRAGHVTPRTEDVQ